MDAIEDWEVEPEEDIMTEEKERTFNKGDYKIEVLFDSEEEHWYIIASDDKPSANIKGERFDDYKNAINEALSRIEYENSTGHLLKEYSVSSETRENKLIVKSIGEFEAAARYLTEYNSEESVLVEDASEFGNDTLYRDMDIISDTITKLRRGELKAEIVKEY